MSARVRAGVRVLGALTLLLVAFTSCAESQNEEAWPGQGISWTEDGGIITWWKGTTSELPFGHWSLGWLPEGPHLLATGPKGLIVFDASEGEVVGEFTCACTAAVGTDPDLPVVVHEYDREEFIWLDADLEPVARVSFAEAVPGYGGQPEFGPPGIYLGDVHADTVYFGYAEQFNERVFVDSIFGLTPDGVLTTLLTWEEPLPQGRMDLVASPDGDAVAYVQHADRSTCDRWASITLLDSAGARDPREFPTPSALEGRSTELHDVHWEDGELRFTARESGFYGHLVMPCADAESLITAALYSARDGEPVLLQESLLMQRTLDNGPVRLTAPEPGEEGPLLQVRRADRWVTIAERPWEVHVQPFSV